MHTKDPVKQKSNYDTFALEPSAVCITCGVRRKPTLLLCALIAAVPPHSAASPCPLPACSYSASFLFLQHSELIFTLGPCSAEPSEVFLFLVFVRLPSDMGLILIQQTPSNPSKLAIW